MKKVLKQGLKDTELWDNGTLGKDPKTMKRSPTTPKDLEKAIEKQKQRIK